MNASARSEMITVARAALVDQAVAVVGGGTPEEQREFRARVVALLDAATEDEIAGAIDQLRATGDDWGYHPPNAFAKRLHHTFGEQTIAPDSTFDGLDALAPVRREKLIFLANHLSYSDANLLQIMLDRHGAPDLAQRLVVVAGPKVYSELFRRFSSLCFGTIKTPQSSSRSSGEAVMSPRDVARLALGTITCAHERLDAGDAVLVFLEGTRSRTASMQPALAAIVRYFEHPGVWLVPVGIAGSERLVPPGEERAHRTRVSVRLGRPIAAGALLDAAGRKRQLAVDAMAILIAELLPESYRGAYAEPERDHAEAAALLRELRRSA